jgi:hypothetical protein
MRRRFVWEEITAEQSAQNMNFKDAEKRMKRLNDAIWNDDKKTGIDGLNSSYHIGAAYFLKLGNYDNNYGDLWKYHLKPLLKEYLRGRDDAGTELEKLKNAYDGVKESGNSVDSNDVDNG